jgi:hypothetical protein
MNTEHPPRLAACGDPTTAAQQGAGCLGTPLICVVALLCCSTPTIALGQQGTTSIDAVVASDAVIVTSDVASWVELTLKNTTSQPVIAWCTEVNVTSSDGSDHEVVQCKDGFSQWEGFPYVLEEPTVVPARGQLRTRIRYFGPTGREQARVTVRCAIFLDGSATGDPRYANLLFDGRQRDSEGWAAVVAALEAGQSAGHGGDALVAAVRAVDTAAAERGAALPLGEGERRVEVLFLEAERRNLHRLLDASPPVAAEEALRQRLAEARRRLAAVQKYLKRPQ